MSEHAPLAAESPMKKSQERSGQTGERQGRWDSNLCGELMKLGVTEDLVILKCFHIVVLTG